VETGEGDPAALCPTTHVIRAYDIDVGGVSHAPPGDDVPDGRGVQAAA
jgi:hypothetical protein